MFTDLEKDQLKMTSIYTLIGLKGGLKDLFTEIKIEITKFHLEI